MGVSDPAPMGANDPVWAQVIHFQWAQVILLPVSNGLSFLGERISCFYGSGMRKSVRLPMDNQLSFKGSLRLSPEMLEEPSCFR